MRDGIRWLVRLRWVAIAGVVIVSGVASRLAVVPGWLPFLVIAGLMASYNVVVVWSARAQVVSGVDALNRLVFVQMLFDVVSLSALLHFADSVENPFVMFFAFPIAVGAMLLSTRLTFVLASATFVVFGGLVLAEYADLVAHRSFVGHEEAAHADPSFRSQRMLFGFLVAFALMVLGVAYLVDNIARRYLRTLWLAEEKGQLALSRERLARVGQISAGVSHAVRNPLHGLINGLDVLSKHVAPEPSAQRMLSLMADGLTRIDTVTRRLLVLTRDVPLSLRPTDLDRLVNETRNFVNSTRGSETHVPLDICLGGAGVVDVDPDQLNEALTNVLDNAIDACTDGGTVTVTTAVRDGLAGTACIEVRDSGTGIATEQAKMVFEPFFTTKAVGSGTGLGLAIARRIIEDHGGTITMESEFGVGTSVRMMIPTRASARRVTGGDP